MKQKVLFIGMWLGLVSVGHTQSTLTLDECYRQTENHSPQAGQTRLIQEATELQLKLLNRNFMPQSRLNGQATWQSDVTSVPIKLPNFEITPPPKDQYKLTLDVTQSIWDGGTIQKQKAVAVANQLADQQKVTVDLYQLREQVSGLFFGALFAERQLKNFDILDKELRAKLAKTKASVQNGIAIRSNILALEARILEVEQLVLETQTRRTASLEALSLLTGANVDANTSLQLPTVAANSSDINRPELKWFDAQKQTLSVSERLVKAKNLPKLSAFATGGYGRPGLNFLSTEFKTYFIGGVQLQIPLSHLYTNSQAIEVQQLRVNQQRVEKQKENFLLATQVRMASQRQEVSRLQALVESDRKLIDIRSTIRKAAESQLENGIITASDYLTELDNEDSARQNLILHEVQLLQAQNNLRLSAGN
ncbi:outer membrane protein TolC [Runella defluvii]|uniref:Outer membrane protein TolC n=1 Tax=Runella defluvii TaxID=370973 RepID=A0A7W5ZQI2_9BACT|nr:TolC family protein [Runella defluvii]MBB3841788.1 outer membrane protein TolC [Runella defluvii]